MSHTCGPRRKEVFTSPVRAFGLAIGAKHAMGLARLWLPTALMKALECIARARGKTRCLIADGRALSERLGWSNADLIPFPAIAGCGRNRPDLALAGREDFLNSG
jgi:hypothetical protein